MMICYFLLWIFGLYGINRTSSQYVTLILENMQILSQTLIQSPRFCASFLFHEESLRRNIRRDLFFRSQRNCPILPILRLCLYNSWLKNPQAGFIQIWLLNGVALFSSAFCWNIYGPDFKIVKNCDWIREQLELSNYFQKHIKDFDNDLKPTISQIFFMIIKDYNFM